MSQALLFGSACAPFVLFSYFLNGIDILQIVTALALAAGWSALLTAAGIALATQAHTKLGRTVAQFAVLGLLGLGAMGGIAFAWVLAEEGNKLVTNAAFRNFVIAVGSFSWGLTWLLLESSAAGLALPSEAASRGPRVALTIVSLLALAFGLVVFVLQDGRGNDASGGQVVTSFFLTVAGAFCISEADGWPSQAANSGEVGRRSGGWLKPGGVRSFWLIIALLLASAAMWGYLLYRSRGSGWSERNFRGIVAAFSYPALYLSLGVLVGRLTPLRHFGEPVATRVGFTVSVVLGIAVSMALALVFEGQPDGKVMNALNPVVGLVNFDRSGSYSDPALVLLCSVTTLTVVLAAVVLHARDGLRSA